MVYDIWALRLFVDGTYFVLNTTVPIVRAWNDNSAQ